MINAFRRPRATLLALAAVAGLAAPRAHAGSLSERVDETRMELMRDPEARQPLEEDEVQKLEKKVFDKPDNIEARLRLLNHYRMDRSTDGRAARYVHVLWFIENAPESDVAGSEFFSKRMMPELFEKADKLWAKHLAENPKSAKIAANAARFYTAEDKDRAEELLKKAQELDPKNPRFTQQLAMFYMMKARDPRSTDAAAAAKSALAQYDVLLKSADERARPRVLDQAAEACLLAGDDERAAKLAEELLKTSVGDPGYGEWIHEGHRILGHVALNGDKVDVAKAELLKAGKTEGSRSLESMGPQLTLAKALLEKGEKDAVLAYLERVHDLWPRGQEAVTKWIEQIKAGEKPELDRMRAMMPPGANAAPGGATRIERRIEN
jgi:tetratricopeptide (TPR) repeat protein